MCSGSKRKVYSEMEGEEFRKPEGSAPCFSVLLELSASDDLAGFKTAVEEGGHDVDELGLWYGRRIGSRKMAYEERTPLLIASMFGSKQVLKYILEKRVVDVNKACGSDGATALHCAVAGGSAASHEVVKLLLDASSDVNLVDANGNRAGDLIAKHSTCFRSTKNMLELMLNGTTSFEEACGLVDQIVDQTEREQVLTPLVSKDGAEKKEYPFDPSLPDIKNGIYGTDEFRMYTFKVKPCSRAYSHDWTECPFVHPGENARRRDPRKYHYSCVPCPDFKKGACQRGDACEYAHGIFECWLHPAQYRTRMCKDEEKCNRRVCFFAHKVEDLRPLYASTGSAVPSPRSFSAGASPFDIASISPRALGSPPVMMPSTSTPPLTPTGASSPLGGTLWPNQPNVAPPTLQLPGSRLKSAINARDVDFDAELLGLENHHFRQQQMLDDVSRLSSPSSWKNNLVSAAAFAASSTDRNGGLGRHAGIKPTNLDDLFGSLDPTVLSQLEELSLDVGSTQSHPPQGIQIRQNLNQQLRASYNSSLSSSPVRASSSFGIDPYGTAAAVLTSRSAAFAKRSQSFIDRSATNRLSETSSPLSPASVMPSSLSDWGSPDGKLDWGIQREELNKLRKSASFGHRSSGRAFATRASSPPAPADEPNVSRFHSLVKDAPSTNPDQHRFENKQHKQYHLNSGASEILPQWVDQLYAEQEQIVA